MNRRAYLVTANIYVTVVSVIMGPIRPIVIYVGSDGKWGSCHVENLLDAKDGQ